MEISSWVGESAALSMEIRGLEQIKEKEKIHKGYLRRNHYFIMGILVQMKVILCNPLFFK